MLPSSESLVEVVRMKSGPLAAQGWTWPLRRKFSYRNPDDYYEACVLELAKEEVNWLDVGCGRDLFPGNEPLARLLAGRVGRLVGLDPDPTLDENPYVHEKVSATMGEYRGEHEFDLVTMRMVAEHVTEPEPAVAAVARALKPGGLTVVYTVNRHSPVPLLTSITPMWVRHRLKRFLWGVEEKDTFPTAYKMNSRRRLKLLFEGAGLREVLFRRLDDCRTLGRFRALFVMELTARKALRAVGLPYPENCLLGVYRARLEPQSRQPTG